MGYIWIGDNEIFTGKFKWETFERWAKNSTPAKESCIGIVIPDVLRHRPDGSVIGDATATLAQFERYAPTIRALGYPVAFVAQDGQESLPFPDQFDTLFIGGSTEWKLSPAADACIKRAQALGKWIHVGRVNSQTRIRHFQLIGADSVDGTSIAYAPDKHLKRFNKQLAQRPLLTI